MRNERRAGGALGEAARGAPRDIVAGARWQRERRHRHEEQSGSTGYSWGGADQDGSIALQMIGWTVLETPRTRIC